VISADKLTFPQSPRGTNVVFVPAQFRLNPEETAQRFSAISRRNAVADLVSVLTAVYKDIEGVSVENSDGSWEVFVQLARLDERIPMALHSSGASRLIAILLAITAAENGSVLIDEIENGFYYKTLPEIWRAMSALAKEFKCQVFASTHSNECLAALSSIVSEDTESFCLLNLESVQGISRITVSPGDVMAAALQSGFELR
jgi:predicted ATPase